MNRTELIAALEAHVETMLALREPELRTINATLQRKLDRAEKERDLARIKLADAVGDEQDRLARKLPGDLVTLAELRRVIAGHDSARAAGTVGATMRLHERIARSLHARMEMDQR